MCVCVRVCTLYENNDHNYDNAFRESFGQTATVSLADESRRHVAEKNRPCLE